MTGLLNHRDVVQVAYVVDDVVKSAEKMVKAFGAGPFYIGDSIPLSHCLYRGREMPLDHTNACGWWGNVMVELVQQNNDGPSAFRDMYALGQEGLHHMATFVKDFDAEVARYEALGCPAANIATTEGGGIRFAYIDARPLVGHMIEFYEDIPAIRGFYAFIEEAAKDWDGSEPIRRPG